MDLLRHPVNQEANQTANLSTSPPVKQKENPLTANDGNDVKEDNVKDDDVKEDKIILHHFITMLMYCFKWLIK